MRSYTLKVIPVVILLLFHVCCFAQSPELGKQVKNVVAPSPNAASLGKYGDVPVGLYTGTAEIKIPIFQIEAKGMQLPVNLSYGSGGLKVSDVGSWAGIGWALNAGGVITRAMAGKPDEQKTLGYFESTPLPTSGNYLNFTEAANKFDYEPDMFFYNFAGGSGKFVFNKQQQISCIPEKKIDITYSTGIYSSLNPGGLLSGLRAITGFTIVAEDGMKYVFEETEELPEQRRRTIVLGSLEQWSSNAQDPGTAAAPQSWFISKMISPLADTIYFDYSVRPILVKLPPSVTVHIPQQITGIAALEKPSQETWVEQTTYTKQLKKIRFKGGSLEFRSYNPRYDLSGDSTLDEIIVRNSKQDVIRKLIFSYRYLVGTNLVLPAVNLFAYQPEEIRLFLNSVQETDAAGNLLKPPYLLDYQHDKEIPAKNALAGDYWGYNNGVMNALPLIPSSQLNTITGERFKRQFGIAKQANEAYMKQGGLTKITYPTGGSTEFEYESHKVTDGRVPPQYAARNASESNFVADKNAIRNAVELGRFTVNDLAGSCEVPVKFEYDAIYQSLAGLSSYYIEIINVATNTTVHTFTAGQCINGAPVLNANNRYECRNPYLFQNGTYKVVARNDDLPPGAMTNFTFFIAVGPWTELETITPPASGIAFGGLRIKKITDRDINTAIVGIKRFEYDQDATIGDFGKYEYNKNYRIFWKPDTDPDLFCEAWYAEFSVFTYNSFYPLQQTQGSYVGYSKTKVFQETINGVDNGYTEFSYASNRTHPSTSLIVEPPFCPQPNNTEWMYGLLLGEKYYKKSGSTEYQVIKDVKHVYKPTVAVTAALGLKAMLKLEIEVRCNTPFAYPNNQPFSQHYVTKDYMVYTGHPVLDSTITTIYENNVELRQYQKYQYNNYFLTNKIISGSSNGEVKESRILYPFDFTGISGVTAISQGMKYLQDHHILSWPIEKSDYLSNPDGTNRRLVSSLFNSYKPSQPVSDIIYSIEGAPFANFEQGTVLSGDVKIDTRYKAEIKFNNYDVLGNLLQQQKVNDVPESYLWGYNKQYPLAKITGADHTTIQQFVSQALLDNVNTTDAQMRTELNNLRVNLPGALVTTYTFTPLVGVTSETDPNGKTVFYEYDGFGRLKLIRDQNNKILKQYDYQYQSPIIQ